MFIFIPNLIQKAKHIAEDYKYNTYLKIDKLQLNLFINTANKKNKD